MLTANSGFSMRLLSLGVVAFATIAPIGRGAAAVTMPQDDENTVEALDRPLTGRDIPCEQGKIALFECENVALLSYLPKHLIGESSGYDLWGWHDSTTGREFVLIGGQSTAFVEVTDPVNPKYLGTLPPHVGVTSHVAQSVKVYRHYALIGYEGATNGLQVFDLTQLRDVKASPMTFTETAHYSGITNIHTIAVNQETGFAYLNGTNTCAGGLHMLDIRTPTAPKFVGCYSNMKVGKEAVSSAGFNIASTLGYVHDTQCAVYRGPDKSYQGHEICFNSSTTALVIVDVTNKQQPKTISIAHYPTARYTHQGWLTEDQRHFFLNDELDEGNEVPTRTIVFDLEDLDDPVVLTEYHNPKTTATDHNLYIRGRYMYQGNYEAGLRIIDVADPQSPKEVGYLTSIGVAWGTYPYFKDDVVAVSSDTGLFLARLKAR